MAQPLVAALDTALAGCAGADLAVLPAGDLAALVVDLRRIACRLEAEIARVVHVADRVEVWRASGAKRFPQVR